ncbi:hypothetical protein [Longimicrobium sp.]|uniref:hypothetical protein n=1 Tax=Longimicrobium sp. TaxID=2029185 RepID=UPI003B3A23F9
MRKMITLMALVALAACDSATASNQNTARSKDSGEARAPEAASLSGGASHRAAIVSVRKRVAGTPALYTARAVSTDGGEVTVEIRSSSGGFSALTSGTFEDTDTGTGEANQDFQTTAGTRYLIIAYPSSGGGATLDATHASFIEIEP